MRPHMGAQDDLENLLTAQGRRSGPARVKLPSVQMAATGLAMTRRLLGDPSGRRWAEGGDARHGALEEIFALPCQGAPKRSSLRRRHLFSGMKVAQKGG